MLNADRETFLSQSQPTCGLIDEPFIPLTMFQRNDGQLLNFDINEESYPFLNGDGGVVPCLDWPAQATSDHVAKLMFPVPSFLRKRKPGHHLPHLTVKYLARKVNLGSASENADLAIRTRAVVFDIATNTEVTTPWQSTVLNAMSGPLAIPAYQPVTHQLKFAEADEFKAFKVGNAMRIEIGMNEPTGSLGLLVRAANFQMQWARHLLPTVKL